MSKVTIIDTGIDLKSKYLTYASIDGISIKKSEFSGQYTVEKYIDDFSCIQDKVGHGTAVSGIITSHNSALELFIIKLFHDNSIEADEDLLCYALEYVLYNVECNIINLSLGICISESSKLYDLCVKLYNNKKYIISAFDNNGAISFPAAYKFVVGVTNSNECYRNNDIFVVDNDLVNVCAKGRAQRIVWLSDTLLVGSGNSYACAHVTGILSKDIENSNIQELLNMKSIGKIEISNKNNIVLSNPVGHYKRVAIFPFNKEMHSLIRFREMLPFELDAIYDIKYSANVGASTNNLLKISGSRNYIIHNIDSINWNTFDTFILGHCDELFGLMENRNFKKKLIEDILVHSKYLYSFDDLSMYNIDSCYEQQIYYPRISMNDVPISPFGKLYRQNKPVLGVFGTSSRQGKFTLQLNIRSGLMQKGYRVAQIGTEPSSLLFGMDAVFPYGYNSTVHINRKDTVSYLNHVMHQVSSEADIIIVGAQSGVVIRDEGNLDNYNFGQVDFLYATLPDAVIVCVNSEDDNEIIARTINFIEASVGCKVIAIVIFPLHYRIQNSGFKHLIPLTDNEFNSYKKELFDNFGKCIYRLDSDLDMAELIDLIINFYSN